MSISSPLPSATYSSKPLELTFSLEHLSAPHLASPSASSSTSSRSTTPISDYEDIFDELDGSRSYFGDAQLRVRRSEIPQDRLAQPDEALTTRTSRLFPDSALGIEENVLRALEGTPAGGGGGLRLPDWLGASSGRVTSLAVGDIHRQDLPSEHSDRKGSEEKTTKTRRTRRVAVGCEDGVVWIFRDSRERLQSSTRSRRARDETMRPASSPLLDGSLQRPPSNASRPASPLAPPSPCSPPSTSIPSPPLPTRRSSASISTLSSFASHPATRNSSSCGPPSLNGSTVTTYSELKCPPEQQRLRKASATVSISTTSMTPSSRPHRHSDSRTSLDHPDLPDEQTSLALPLLSPVERQTSPHVGPLSPTPTRAPQFQFSSSSDTESVRTRTTPSPPGSRKRPPHSFGLSSKKEQPPRSTDSSGKGGETRSHSRISRESITNGIGLWEANSSMTDIRSTGTDGLGIEDSGRDEAGTEESEEDYQETWDTGDLEPIFKALTPGSGPVIDVEMVAEERLSRVSYRSPQGAALVVLRRSGHLSVISLHEGRCLGSCRAGGDAKGEFGHLRIIEREQGSLALCTFENDDSKSLICIDLESLTVVQIVEGVDLYAVVPSPASYSVLTCMSGSNEIVSRPVAAAASGSVIGIGNEVETRGTLESWNRIQRLRSNGRLIVGWDDTGLSISALDGDRFSQVALIPLSMIQDVTLLPHSERFIVSTNESMQIYKLASQKTRREVILEVQYASVGVECCYLLPSAVTAKQVEMLISRSDGGGKRFLDYVNIGFSVKTRTVYTSPSLSSRGQVTRSHKLDSDSTILGFSNGATSLVPTSYIGKDLVTSPVNAQLDGAITVLDVIDLGGRGVVLAGSAGGSVGFWHLESWEEIAIFSLFASPVLSHAHLSLPSHSHTLLFVSDNSPVALVSLDPLRLLFTLPGSKTRAKLVATTKQGEVMVLYKEGLARVWDAETGELRRSMDQRTAQGVLNEQEKGWRVWFNVEDEDQRLATAAMTHPFVTFDVRSTLEDAARDLPWSNSKQPTPKRRINGFDSLDATPDVSRAASPAPLSTNGRPSSTGSDELDVIRRWLSNLIPFGIDIDCDKALDQLGIVESTIHLPLATHQAGSLSFPALDLPRSSWTLSPHSTAHRLLLITCLLRLFLNYPSTERVASEAIVFFTSFLADSVGPEFQRPSLDFFADYWLDKNPEVQQAAKTLFGTYLAALSGSETVELVQVWERYLPIRQAPHGSPHSKADVAVLLIGLVAVDRFKLLSTSILTGISLSVASYLEEAQHPFHQALATELCSRGFHIWQNYVDAMALVRQLFSIAIGRNPLTPSDLRAVARQATVHVAGVNSPLFMTTLLFDILNSPTAISRNATLKLLGFMIRKKPLVLHHSLPRVVEAVVKSLDPTISDLRETVHQTATVILNELVRTFPSIDFQGKSQRLAVGTQEGSVIVYDLKTATRLYVLDGHRRPLTAVSWSADGHRLATVCLDESRVCVWKTGMGILSLIGAPTQRAGSPPFKEWDFHVGDEALMTTAATLEWIIVDWPAERTVRLRIRETALSFGA